MTDSVVPVVTKLPQIPNKYEIIPIHTSDIGTFKQCRRKWDWSSPTRTNLRRSTGIYGVVMPLWFGTGIHYALEKKYDPILSRDPLETFSTWYELQWHGGQVGEEWLEYTYDPNPRLVPQKQIEGVYHILGLKDILPNPEAVQEEFEAHRVLGLGMLAFYEEFAAKNDDFVAVASESVYSIPLGFEARDRREDSPNYGEMLEVHARGKRDIVVYWPEFDKYGVLDHKTAEKVDEDYFLKLVKDEQCSNYLWATIQESLLSPDLPWYGKIVDRVVYNVLRKNYPHAPLITSYGYPSLDRSKQACTAGMFEEYVRDNDLMAWFNKTEKAQHFYTYLLEMGDSQFIQRELVFRNEHEIRNTGNHIRMIAEDMLADDLHIYPNPVGNYSCTRCSFRPPCIAADDGSDWQGLLAEGYEPNKGR